MNKVTTTKDIYEALGKFALAILNMAYVIGCNIFSGFVLSILWGWFIVSTFGLPALTIPLAMGIMLVVGYLSKQVDFNNQDREDYQKRMNVVMIVKPLVALVVGYVIKSFI
jgi:formate-dependent nitrite reductase membrane component NrfD